MQKGSWPAAADLAGSMFIGDVPTAAFIMTAAVSATALRMGVRFMGDYEAVKGVLK